MVIEMNIIDGWLDDLIWCPSQCFLYFTVVDQHYCIYLRWRHHDPWTAELIKTSYEKELHIESEWYYLEIPFFDQDADLNDIKEASIIAAINKIAELTTGAPDKA